MAQAQAQAHAGKAAVKRGAAESPEHTTKKTLFTTPPSYVAELPELDDVDTIQVQTASIESNANNKIDNSMELTLFVKGQNRSILGYMKKPQINIDKILAEITLGFGKVASVFPQWGTDSLKIICGNQQQYNVLLGLTQMNSFPITVNKPYKMQLLDKQALPKVKQQKAVIDFRGIELTEQQIKDITGAERVTRYISGKNTPFAVERIILTFSESQEIPEEIKVGNQIFYTEGHVPAPLRCDVCQKYGHHKSTCSKKPVCSYCAMAHSYINCTNKQDAGKRKCANCNGDHSAAYKGCPIFLNVQQTLEIQAINKITFSEAKMAMKKHTEEIKVTSESVHKTNPWNHLSLNKDNEQNNDAEIQQEISALREENEKLKQQVTTLLQQIEHLNSIHMKQQEQNNQDVLKLTKMNLWMSAQIAKNITNKTDLTYIVNDAFAILTNRGADVNTTDLLPYHQYIKKTTGTTLSSKTQIHSHN